MKNNTSRTNNKVYRKNSPKKDKNARKKCKVYIVENGVARIYRPVECKIRTRRKYKHSAQ